jgi:hypothetical protein
MISVLLSMETGYAQKNIQGVFFIFSESLNDFMGWIERRIIFH